MKNVYFIISILSLQMSSVTFADDLLGFKTEWTRCSQHSDCEEGAGICGASSYNKKYSKIAEQHAEKLRPTASCAASRPEHGNKKFVFESKCINKKCELREKK